MNCCCARKPTTRDAAPSSVAAPVRRGMPSKSAPGQPVGGLPGRGPLGGVGIVFQAGQMEEGLLVASLAVDGPAEQSGQVRAGDILVSIDQTDVRKMNAEDLAQYILGPPGSSVRLGFVRQGTSGGVVYVDLTRGWTMKRSADSKWSNPLPANHQLVPGALGPQ
mmetsp:Transcript_8611/g.17195  ORF Transcript_8611/g.17195 Transcript_8611/m.17195 type:complete len:164 (+) Transcript_8611:90-581(+)|eukprot:CAMPEP_0196758596 /NCGR_PEP_ID=MMETSP1091-20130531/104269_1 /TAXON_ID=302021 /ORGANISM="Rhodomonas sp., Strain CCMP768" /LENGTH=163 /DNA_ID=CAMNT_0042107425 /DNA_START=83 /DNA_END=574 /DNA_ORIENTATION=-